MAYEAKIFCGIVYKSIKENGLSYFETVAMIDLSAVDVIPATKGIRVYYYEEGMKIVTDAYGDTLMAIPVAEMLEKVKKAQLLNPTNRRWKPTIALLESFLDFSDDDIYCFVYGY